MHWRSRSKGMATGADPADPEEAVWVGAYDDNVFYEKLSHPAHNILLDEFQIIGRVLNQDEILALQRSPAANPDGAETSVAATGSAADTVPMPAPASATSTSHLWQTR